MRSKSVVMLIWGFMFGVCLSLAATERIVSRKIAEYAAEVKRDREKAAAINEYSMGTIRDLEAQLTKCKIDYAPQAAGMLRVPDGWRVQSIRVNNGTKKIVGICLEHESQANPYKKEE